MAPAPPSPPPFITSIPCYLHLTLTTINFTRGFRMSSNYANKNKHTIFQKQNKNEHIEPNKLQLSLK